MTNTRPLRCAIYTRKSSENGLEQSFNSLHAQREACEAYIKSQAHEGWVLRPTQYDDGGISGGHMERPALHQLIEDIKAQLVDVVVVYKVDRLSRSLADFVQLVQLFDAHNVSFVSITQHFNTSSSMGRLTLNVLLSFAQFEREVTSERIRDKIAASKRKGMWMGGNLPLGYDVKDKRLVVDEAEALTVRHIYSRYLALGCVRRLKEELDRQGYVSKARPNGQGARPFSRGALYTLLRNPIYVGKVRHKKQVYDGEHEPIVEVETWDEAQAQLKANRSSAKRRDHAKEPSLLAGLLFDDRGNPMSPTHATKGDRRYRYYISQALLKYEENKAGSIKRVSAEDIERPVIDRLSMFLSEPGGILDAFGSDCPEINGKRRLIERADALARALQFGEAREQIAILNDLISRIELGRRRLDIRVDALKLRRRLTAAAASSNTNAEGSQPIVLSSEARLKRCGMESKLIIGRPEQRIIHSDSVAALQKAVLKALEWSDALLTGKAKTVTELAEKEGLSQRYLSSLMPLAFLAPAIIEKIAQGAVPLDLSLEKLKSGFPRDWREQSAYLGFDS